jgi:hypothetical protein
MSAPHTAPARRVPAQRTAPQRSQTFEHLTLEALRAHRQALQTEEQRVSYWRRIVQARVDMLTAASSGRLDLASLRPVLAETRPGARRPAALTVVTTPDSPPLPDLAGLWEQEPGDDDAARAELIGALEQAEQQLSAYRASLHRRLDAATAELVARYHEQPTLCLSVLPLRRERTTS